MRIYFNRASKILQIFPEVKNLQEYVSLKVYHGVISPLEADESFLLKEVSPATMLLIPFQYSYQQTGNIYVVGVRADKTSSVIAQAPITSGAYLNSMYDNAHRGLKTRKGWYLKLRKERAKIYFKSVSTVCSCFDLSFNTADPNCSVCGGSGKTAGYVGSEFDVMVENDVKRTKILTPNGRSVTVDSLEAWIFEFPFVNDECILERSNGDRYTINNTVYKHFGGQLVEMSFNLVLISDSFNYTLTLIGG